MGSVSAPGYAALHRRAKALMVAGCLLAAAAGAYALSAFFAAGTAARVGAAIPLFLPLAGGMALGYGLARFRHRPQFQGLGPVVAISVPIAFLFALAAGYGTSFTAFTVAAFAGFGCEAVRPWGPNLLLALPLIPAAVHAAFFVTDGGTLADGLEVALIATAALLAYELARLGEGFAEAWTGLTDGSEGDARARRVGARTFARATLGALGLTGIVAALALVLLYWKEAAVGRGGATELLGDPGAAVPILVALLALSVVGLLYLQGRGEDEARR